MKNAKLGHLGWADIVKGFFTTVAGAVLTAATTMIGSGSLPKDGDWKLILGGALIAGGSYLIKQLSTNSNGDLMTKEDGQGSDKAAQ